MFSIGITTFEARFDKYFVPLVERIKKYAPHIETIVTVNGENRQAFSEEYRARMLSFLSTKQNVFPVFSPLFRGLAKLWNTIIIQSSNEFILMLNDDIQIENPEFVRDIDAAIQRQQGKMFYCNHSWSHFVISKTEADELGYFDERLLGIGEEDGDFTWRYLDRHGIRIPNIDIKGFVNFTYDTMTTYKPTNIQCHSGTKYSLFNRLFLYNEKYRRDNVGFAGMFDFPMVSINPCVKQYPYEKFYQQRKEEL